MNAHDIWIYSSMEFDEKTIINVNYVLIVNVHIYPFFMSHIFPLFLGHFI